ncbi:MAG: hypothetical protein ACK4Z0_02110 [Sphingomonadaceae bacterium]
MRARPALPALLLVSACAAPGGSFPTLAPRPAEQPRVIVAPGGSGPATLSAEERAALEADVEREMVALAALEADLAAADRAFERALAAARRAPPGSAAWSDAQMILSRFEVARAPYADVEARLSPLLRTIDSLPADDPDRQAVESLAAAAGRSADAAEARALAARRQLGG